MSPRVRSRTGSEEDARAPTIKDIEAAGRIDDGNRPKLSKARFSELSEEMMDLVTWENVEPLPPAEKRRMRELEYLLIG